MKHAKKLVSLLLALVMLLSLTSTTAFAANDDGSITISNATVGQTYTIYKVFDLTYSEDNVAYSFTKTESNTDLYYALISEGSPFTLTATTTENVYNVSLKESQTSADVSTFLTSNKNNLTPTASMEAATNEVKFGSLPYGYYYITSSLGTVVTVDSTLKDVTVIDKNQGPSWDNEPGEDDETGEDNNPGKVIIENGVKKTVNSAYFGDKVDFNISVNATAYVGKDLATHYYIKDTLADGFSPAESIVVKVGDQTLVKDTEYTLTQTGNFFEIAIPFGEKYGSNAVISVSYSATVRNTAAIAGEGNLNTANFTYSTDSSFNPDDPGYNPKNPTDPAYPNPDNPTKPYDQQNEKTTTTYVYALGIKKVDPKGNVLTGAEFSVTDEDGNTIKATGANGVYEYAAEGSETQFAMDDKGVLIIKGLKAGTYTIKEEVAPAGYNLLTATVDVTAEISENGTYTTKITTYYDADGNVVGKDESDSSIETIVNTNVVPLVVVNNAGTELPSTGGMGTTLFYVLGSLLVVVAVVLLVAKKRMSQAER